MNPLSWLTASTMQVPTMQIPTMQILGWTLIHFLWQGAALAAILSLALPFCRTALARYTAALATLVLMVCSPLATFLFLEGNSDSSFQAAGVTGMLQTANALVTSPASAPVSIAFPFESSSWLTWFVVFWLTGVLVFSVRAFGGWFVLERLRREKAEQLPQTVGQCCLAWQHRLGIARTVRYLGSRLFDTPAVIGWFRPVVLLPLTALTSLSPQQLEAVIVHELAHIKRLDGLVNLFQIAAETLLFYHPAVWWVNRCVRAERENCCDDMAVMVCGDAVEYARALTLMESWRATPSLVLAANSGSLKLRVSRLLGFQTITHNIPRAGLAAIGLVCAAGVLLAGTTFNRTYSHLSDFEPSTGGQKQESTPPAPPDAAPPPAPATPSAPETALAIPEDQDAPRPPEEAPAKESYIAGLESAGLKNLNVDQIIALKVQGVTPEYIRAIRAEGLDPNIHELLGMKVQGITPQYVREIRATGLKPSINDFIALRVQGVTADYVRGIQAQGWKNVTVSQIIGMRVQGVKPSDAATYQQLGLKDVTPDQLIALRVQGVTPDYVRAMQSAGFTNLSTNDYLGAKVQGVTPEFIQKVRSHGFTNLSLHQLMALKMANVF